MVLNDMNDDEHKQPPTNVKEVGIHIGYLREDIGDVKALLENHISLAATKADIAAHDVRISKLEEIIEKVMARIVGAAITILVLMVLALYGLDKFFR
jgi:hypothetical protein